MLAIIIYKKCRHRGLVGDDKRVDVKRESEEEREKIVYSYFDEKKSINRVFQFDIHTYDNNIDQ